MPVTVLYLPMTVNVSTNFNTKTFNKHNKGQALGNWLQDYNIHEVVGSFFFVFCIIPNVDTFSFFFVFTHTNTIVFSCNVSRLKL